MTREEIVILLDNSYTELCEWLEKQDDDKWVYAREGKWTTGQHCLHLLQSIKPVNLAMSLPKFVLRYRFGKANRDVRSYEKVISRYKERLASKPTATFGPSRKMKIPRLNDKNYLLNRITTESKKLQYKVNKWSDDELDRYILPHPLMGKMPVREILMWSAYHVTHHLNSLKTSYQ